MRLSLKCGGTPARVDGNDAAFPSSTQESALAGETAGTRQARSQKPFAICVKKLLIAVPTNVAQATTVIDISTNIRAYSITVAPEASLHSADRTERVRSNNVAIPGGMLPLLESKTASGPVGEQVPERRRSGQRSCRERSSVRVRSSEMSAFFPAASTHFDGCRVNPGLSPR